MSILTCGDPAIRQEFDSLRHALAALDPAFRRDLRRIAADPARVGAAGLTAGVYAVVVGPQRAGRWACPTTCVLLLRGETSWPALVSYQATCFDALHETPTWNDWSPSGGAIEDFHTALDELADAAGWARPGRGPQPGDRAGVAIALQGLLLRLLSEMERGQWS
jgi:hypothetical protein